MSGFSPSLGTLIAVPAEDPGAVLDVDPGDDNGAPAPRPTDGHDLDLVQAHLGRGRAHETVAERGLIDAAEITIEPVSFAAGLPLLSGRQGQDPIASLDAVGLRLTSTLRLNAVSYTHLTLPTITE